VLHGVNTQADFGERCVERFFMVMTVHDKLRGKFLVLDGPDGSGKTVQLGLLAAYLEALEVPVVRANDPGGTRIGEQISDLLKYKAEGHMAVNTEVMLFMASRAQLVSEIIRPALAEAKSVLCDRFISATCAYQGSNGYPTDDIIQLGRFAVGDTWPNLTIIIDLPVEEGLERTGRKPYQKTKVAPIDAGQGFLFQNVVVDRFDSRPLNYHRKVRTEYLRLANYYPGIVRVINASQRDIESVHQEIRQIIEQTEF
jgi:dTMP kinase